MSDAGQRAIEALVERVLTYAESRHIIESAEGWHPDAEPFDQTDLDAYTLAALRLQRHAVSDVRAGIELALADRSAGVRESAVANVFVLLRVLFDVPETIAQTSLRNASPYAVWVDRPASSVYPLRWPVTVDARNVVTGIASFMATRGGGPYPALDDLDGFAATYGFRDLPACAGRCGDRDAGEACQCDDACLAAGDCCLDYDDVCGGPDEAAD